MKAIRPFLLLNLLLSPLGAEPAALLEKEWAEAAAFGLSRPPSREAADALPAAQREAQSQAIKWVLLWRYLYNRQEKHRVSPSTLTLLTELAKRSGAPASFTQALALEAKGQISARQRYFANKAIKDSASAYRVDEYAIRRFAELHKAPFNQLFVLLSSPQFPLAEFFNLPRIATPQNKAEATAQYEHLAADLEQALQLLKASTSLQSANEAARKLKPYLGSYETLLYMRKGLNDALLTQLDLAQALKLKELGAGIIAEMKRLDAQNFYGSHALSLLYTLLR